MINILDRQCILLQAAFQWV